MLLVLCVGLLHAEAFRAPRISKPHAEAFRAPRINKPHAYGITRLHATAAAEHATAASVSAHFKVFIEDTDCFQIVFYANYLRYYQRALADLAEGPARPRVVSTTQMRYAKPAIMGDALRVEGALEAVEDGVSYWRARVVRATATGDDEVLNSALLGVQFDGAALPPSLPAEASAPAPARAEAERAAALAAPGERLSLPSLPVTVHDDERDATGARPPLTSVLRYFERGRTAGLGGPESLQRIADEGLSVVVGRVEGVGFAEGVRDDEAWAGAKLTVLSSAVIKRRGIVSFRHDLVREDDSLVATGEMVCFFIRADDGRPAQLPEWLTPVLRCLTPENG